VRRGIRAITTDPVSDRSRGPNSPTWPYKYGSLCKSRTVLVAAAALLSSMLVWVLARVYGCVIRY
jgi:hypothetical protein